jgi:hypothetical protein
MLAGIQDCLTSSSQLLLMKQVSLQQRSDSILSHPLLLPSLNLSEENLLWIFAVSMFCIRFILFLILSIVLVQAETNNYLLRQKVIPASRIVTDEKTATEPGIRKDDVLEFQSVNVLEFQPVKTISGSKPAASSYKGRLW